MKTIKEIAEQEDRSFEEDDSPDIPPPDIVAYNESRSCADLYRMYTQGLLEIQPEFQREIVWKGPAQTRFVDSLIKQLPIPSLCFSLDYKSQRWQVIDGLQRMSSIIRFLGGDPTWTLSRLDDIDSALSGVAAKRFLDKDSPLHGLRQRVENLTLPITVLRCDYSKKSHTSYLFTIFHRLNTGAMKLNNQEIRNCIYAGRLNDLPQRTERNSELAEVESHESAYRASLQRTGATSSVLRLHGRLFIVRRAAREIPQRIYRGSEEPRRVGNRDKAGALRAGSDGGLRASV